MMGAIIESTSDKLLRILPVGTFERNRMLPQMLSLELQNIETVQFP